jgi:hypothetical protein
MARCDRAKDEIKVNSAAGDGYQVLTSSFWMSHRAGRASGCGGLFPP